MQKQIGFFLSFFLLMFSSFALAAEQVALEVTPFPEVEYQFSASQAFQVIGSDTGDLITLPGKVFTEGGEYTGMTLPELISTPVPIAYPKWAIAQGWEGEFVIAIEVLMNGEVGRYAVTKSTGHQVLDEAATAAVKSWKFQPAELNREPVLTCVQIPVQFELRDRS